MQNAISQFNIQYIPLEDRLIFSILAGDKSEIKLWFTRRYSKLLLKVFDKVLEKEPSDLSSPHARDIQQFEHDQEIADIDFQAEYQGGKSVDNPDQPVLVSKVSYRFLDNGNLSLSFAQEIADGISVSLVLDKKLKHAFLEMLLKVNEAAGWDIDLQSYQSALLDNSQSASKVH